MPFDGTNNETVRALMDARARVAAGWCQDRGRDAGGKTCAGIALANARAGTEAWTLFERSIDPPSSPRQTHDLRDHTFIVKWNDAPGRTQAEVLAAFDRAIEMAIEMAMVEGV